MFPIAISATLLMTAATIQTPNPACAMITAPEVTSLVGAGARTIPVGASDKGGSCMYQNGDKIVTILYLKNASTDDISLMWSSKKRAASAQDLAGLSAKAYEGGQGTVAILGITKNASFLEVKLVDPTQKLPALAPKLRAVMKAAATRL